MKRLVILVTLLVLILLALGTTVYSQAESPVPVTQEETPVSVPQGSNSTSYEVEAKPDYPED